MAMANWMSDAARTFSANGPTYSSWYRWRPPSAKLSSPPLSPALQSRSGTLDGRLDIVQESNVRDPDEGSDLLLDKLDLAGILRVSSLRERLLRRFEGVGLLGTHEELAALKGAGVLAGVDGCPGRAELCGR